MNKPNYTILIAEDNNINRKLLKKLLEHRFDCIFAHDGQEAIDAYIKAHAENLEKPVRVILMDMEMPNVNGLQATQKIREYEAIHHLQTLIIGVSGNARPAYKQAAIEGGMDYYITKPYDKLELLNHIYLANSSGSPNLSSEHMQRLGFFSPATAHKKPNEKLAQRDTPSI